MPETIGQRLKKAREDRYLSLEKASEDTRIRRVFLQALEADDYSIMPSAAQGRGFLRNYADYLGLDIDAMIAEIQRSAPPPQEVVGPLPEVNLIETDIPPLIESEAAPLFWKRWFARRARTESPPEWVQDSPPAVEPAPVLSEPAEAEKSKPRKGGKKKIQEEPPPLAEATENQPQTEISHGEDEQAQIPAEAAQGIFARLAPAFRFSIQRGEAQSAPAETEAIEEKTSQPVPALPADVIFAEIGKQLRERRELISLTAEEVEKHTKLRAAFVKALEEGSFEKLPSPVQTRGMLANYAAFLDMDVDAVLLRFADALQARRREKYAETPREKIQTQVHASIPPLRTFIAGDLIFGMAVIGLLIALAVWGVGRVMRLQAERERLAQATAPSIADVLSDYDTPTPTVEVMLLPAETPVLPAENNGAAAQPAAPSPSANAKIVVALFAIERTYVRVSADGDIAFEGRMAPRETKVFEADEQITVLTGNAAALRVTYNGQDLGLMGGIGEVVIRVYLESGVATPTATLPPTPTNTPPVTPTFTPTHTPTATPPTDQ